MTQDKSIEEEAVEKLRAIYANALKQVEEKAKEILQSKINAINPIKEEMTRKLKQLA